MQITWIKQQTDSTKMCRMEARAQTSDRGRHRRARRSSEGGRRERREQEGGAAAVRQAPQRCAAGAHGPPDGQSGAALQEEDVVIPHLWCACTLRCIFGIHTYREICELLGLVFGDSMQQLASRSYARSVHAHWAPQSPGVGGEQRVGAAGDPVPASLAAIKPAGKKNKRKGGDSEGGSGSGTTVDPHVAYCMMTFIVRNGLKNLKESKAAYRDYVRALVKRCNFLYVLADIFNVPVHLFAHDYLVVCPLYGVSTVTLMSLSLCRHSRATE